MGGEAVFGTCWSAGDQQLLRGPCRSDFETRVVPKVTFRGFGCGKAAEC